MFRYDLFFLRCLLLGENKSPKVYHKTVNVCLERARDEADENHSYFWMRQTKRWRRV